MGGYLFIGDRGIETGEERERVRWHVWISEGISKEDAAL
jgi:hypothetical protein